MFTEGKLRKQWDVQKYSNIMMVTQALHIPVVVYSSSGNHRGCAMPGGYVMFVYVLCLEHRLSFSTRVPMQSLTTANQWRTLKLILSPSSMWKTSARLPWMGFEPTTYRSTICILSIGLHRSLQSWKRLISGNGISMESQTMWRSFPVINIFKLYMFIKHSWFVMLQVSNCWETKAWGNHEGKFTVKSE